MTAVEAPEASGTELVDLAETPLRELNRRLHALATSDGPRHWRVFNPDGAHAVACGLDADVEVEIDGHVGYYCAGMNKRATVRVHGNAGTGVAENLMSGVVVVDGSASQSAGATGRRSARVVRHSPPHSARRDRPGHRLERGRDLRPGQLPHRIPGSQPGRAPAVEGEYLLPGGGPMTIRR